MGDFGGFSLQLLRWKRKFIQLKRYLELSFTGKEEVELNVELNDLKGSLM